MDSMRTNVNRLLPEHKSLAKRRKQEQIQTVVTKCTTQRDSPVTTQVKNPEGKTLSNAKGMEHAVGRGMLQMGREERCG
jgi:hypothetical protein